MFELCLRNLPAKYRLGDDMDMDVLASQFEGYSCDDISKLCAEAQGIPDKRIIRGKSVTEMRNYYRNGEGKASTWQCCQLTT